MYTMHTERGVKCDYKRIKEAYTESIPENKLWTFIKNGLSFKIICMPCFYIFCHKFTSVFKTINMRVVLRYFVKKNKNENENVGFFLPRY